tara:strand:- start:339 stop:842 length:504 start_codon:yes stop_codon:yes gene_type:complete
MDIKLLSTTSLSGSNSHSITAFTSEYTLYGFTFSGVQGDGGQFALRFNEGGTAASGASDYSRFRRTGTNSTDWVDDHQNSDTSEIRLGYTALNTSSNISGFGYIYGSQNSGRFTTMFVKGVTGTTSTVYNSYNTGRLEKNSIVDGVTIFSDTSQNFTNGKFTIYGYK